MIHNISARGVLEKGNEILFIEYEDLKGILYSLPGGSQKTGEDLKATLKREFKEETCLDVEVHEVILVREFMLDASEFIVWKNGIHQVEIIFRCTQTDKTQQAMKGLMPDGGMIGIKWIDKSELENLRVYPSKDLPKILGDKNISYLLNRD